MSWYVFCIILSTFAQSKYDILAILRELSEILKLCSIPELQPHNQSSAIIIFKDG